MKTILAAIDLSRVADLEVVAAADLAQELGGTLVLVTVLAEPAFLKEYAPLLENITEITAPHERAVRKRLESMRAKLEANSVRAEVVVCRGAVAANILDAANNRDAAFIVIGSHGQGGLFELILGSTTQRVLKGARQPGVVIPHKMRMTRRAIRPESRKPEKTPCIEPLRACVKRPASP